jgi:hypothetical protein
MNEEDDEWESWIRNEVHETHHFTVHYSIKKYSLNDRDLFADLLNYSSEAYAYCYRKYSESDPLIESGWVLSGKRYKKDCKTQLTPSTFYNSNHSFVFVINTDGFNLQNFFSICSSPFIVHNAGSGKVKNAWVYSRNTGIKKDKLVFCKSYTSPPSFDIVGGEKSIKSALNILLDEISNNKT